MDLYLIRHAEAVEVGEAGAATDAERPLTPHGHDQSQTVTAGLQRRGVSLQVLVTSPLVRAQQTAEDILRHWPHPVPDLRVCDDLAPHGKRRRLTRFLTDLAVASVGLVGHMPDLGEYGGWLLGHRKVPLELAKAGAALIRCDDQPGKGRGTLVWLVTPEWLAS